MRLRASPKRKMVVVDVAVERLKRNECKVRAATKEKIKKREQKMESKRIQRKPEKKQTKKIKQIGERSNFTVQKAF